MKLKDKLYESLTNYAYNALHASVSIRAEMTAHQDVRNDVSGVVWDFMTRNLQVRVNNKLKNETTK